MPVKTYGIYLLYSPTVDLRSQGLSRYLAEFLKAAQHREDVRFVIACPSWIHEKLAEFFLDFGIQADQFSIISPKRQPWILRFYEYKGSFKGESKWKKGLSWLLRQVQTLKSRYQNLFLQYLVGARTKREALFLLILSPFLVASSVSLVILFIPDLIFRVINYLNYCINLVVQKLEAKGVFLKLQSKGLSFNIAELWKSQVSYLATFLYQLIIDGEAALMLKLIESRKDILAWYSPTAFWTQFSQISAPRLICVPDVVLAEFPVGFSRLENNRLVNNFRQVEEAIRSGENFVTYSETIKWNTLVDRYQVIPDNIHVIPHGANLLGHLIRVSGFSDDEAATNSLCRMFLRSALYKSYFINPASIATSTDFRFLFYASQFRPNKNVISLLKSYEYLLRRRHMPHKLVLTGSPKNMPDIAKFITDHNLQYDVLCLVGLSEQELAACYRLADLAVNPTFSEGGCPFTFTEALSVGTPVVMSRISVTEEVITDEVLQEMMLFNPYNWKEMADKIEWAIHHREELLSVQEEFYSTLVTRSWQEVVSDHIDVLEKISYVDL